MALLNTVLGRFAVPAFLFISGLVLTLSYKKGFSIKIFYKKRFFRIVIPYLLFSFLGILLLPAWGETLSVDVILLRIALFDMVSYYYFIALILELYLLFPLLVKGYEWLSKRSLGYVLVIGAAVLQIGYYLFDLYCLNQVIVPGSWGWVIQNRICFGWIFYFTLGIGIGWNYASISEYFNKRVTAIALVSTIAVFFFANQLFYPPLRQLFPSFELLIATSAFCDMILCLSIGVLMLSLFRRVNRPLTKLAFVAESAFIIYLVHGYWQMGLVKVLPIQPTDFWFYPVLFSGILAGSYLTSYIYFKIAIGLSQSVNHLRMQHNKTFKQNKIGPTIMKAMTMAFSTLLIFFLLVSALNVLPLIPLSKSQTTTKQVSITLILNFAAGKYAPTIAELKDWFAAAPKANYTLVLYGYKDLNASSVAFLKSVGECIPYIYPWIQRLAPSDRLNEMNASLKDWETQFGSLPKGVFTFQPDTATTNYLYQNGIEYVTGYCFDQYAIDYMTMRGGWQMPYYASSWNVLAPNNETNEGIVVYPHLTWDWIDSFTINHVYSTHPIHSEFNEEYILNLIYKNLNSTSPYGYASFMFEWGWVKAYSKLHRAETIIENLTSDNDLTILNLSDLTKWFKDNYDATPTYTVNFTSPNSGESIEWYYSKDWRIARISNQVVSFIEYGKQSPDIYLTEKADINVAGEKNSTNDIDNSLKFTIDALGGAPNRAPINQSGYVYSGDLANFPSEYGQSKEFNLLPTLILAPFIVCVIVLIILRKRMRFRFRKTGSVS